MAGAGYKTFLVGEILEAAEVNTYLMEQSIMVFSGTAARGTAIGTAVAEGMVSYLADSDSLEVYNGTSWNAVGGGDVGFEQSFLLMGA